MPRARHVFRLYGCAACGWRTWTTDDEPAPVHRCLSPGVHRCLSPGQPAPLTEVALTQELGHHDQEGA